MKLLKPRPTLIQEKNLKNWNFSKDDKTQAFKVSLLYITKITLQTHNIKLPNIKGTKVPV